jgi:hypothetical protein
MKTLRLIIPAFIFFLLAGCFDINEQIDIKSNGSGVMLVNLDMSQMLEMMQSYMGKEEIDKQTPKRVMDTTVYLKDVVDTAKSISEETKALIRPGSVHMKLNMDEKVFKADVRIPFESLANLQKLYNSFSDGSLGLGTLFKGMSAGRDSMVKGPMPDFNQLGGLYDFKCSDGIFSRKLNESKWKAMQESPEFAQIKQVGSMGMEMPLSVVMKFPRPVKQVDNPIATISDDRKSVTIKYNLLESFDNPQKYSFTITY